MPNCVPAVRCTKTRHSSGRISLGSAGVSWRTLIGHPSYARNRACTLPSPSPFHYVMAKIVPSMQLVARAKSSTLYRRQKFFLGSLYEGALETRFNSVAKPTEFVPKPFLTCLTFFVTLGNTGNFGVY